MKNYYINKCIRLLKNLCFKKWRSFNADFTLLEYSAKVDSELNLIIKEEIFTVSYSILIQTLFDTDKYYFSAFHSWTSVKKYKSKLSQSQFIDN